MPARKAKPTRVPLDKARVVDAAVHLGDRVGLDGLTMRTLAKDLGVVPMAIYKHVANKEDLLDAMVDIVFAEITLPSVKAPWKKAMRERALSMRQALSRHRWAVGVMENRMNPGLATMHHHNATIGCLREAGFPFRNAVHVYSALDSYIYGFALQQKTAPYQTPEESAQHIEHQVQAQPSQEFAAQFPYLLEVARELAKSGYDYDVEFEVGLDILLDGVEKLRKDWKSK